MSKLTFSAQKSTQNAGYHRARHSISVFFTFFNFFRPGKIDKIDKTAFFFRIWRSQAHGKGKKSPRTPTTPLAKMASKLNEESISVGDLAENFGRKTVENGFLSMKILIIHNKLAYFAEIVVKNSRKMQNFTKNQSMA